MRAGLFFCHMLCRMHGWSDDCFGQAEGRVTGGKRLAWDSHLAAGWAGAAVMHLDTRLALAVTVRAIRCTHSSICVRCVDRRWTGTRAWHGNSAPSNQLIDEKLSRHCDLVPRLISLTYGLLKASSARRMSWRLSTPTTMPPYTPSSLVTYVRQEQHSAQEAQQRSQLKASAGGRCAHACLLAMAGLLCVAAAAPAVEASTLACTLLPPPGPAAPIQQPHPSPAPASGPPACHPSIISAASGSAQRGAMHAQHLAASHGVAHRARRKVAAT
jgi:hypothetical protein